MELLTSNKKRIRLVNRAINLDRLMGKEEALSFETERHIEKSAIKAKAATNFQDLELIDDKDVQTFSKIVKKYMDKYGITTKDIYRNSLINRKLFSALNVNDNYVPSKETAIMYCFALKLSYQESLKLLTSAGYTLYEQSNFDLIIKYFLEHNIYNIDKLNDTLYLYTNKCIGYR